MKLHRPEQGFSDSAGEYHLARSAQDFQITATSLPPDQTMETDANLGLEAEGILIDLQSGKPHSASDLLEDKNLVSLPATLHAELNPEVLELAFDRGLKLTALLTETRRALQSVLKTALRGQKWVSFSSVYPLGKLDIIKHPVIDYFVQQYGDAVVENAGYTGLQIHREFRDGNFAIHLYNVLRTVTHYFTPFILNSPFTMDGRYRGLYSERMHNKRLHVLGGIAPRIDFDKLEDYLGWYQKRIDTAVYEGASATNYDIRPPRFHTNTIEINNLDICEDTRIWFALLDFFNRLCDAVARHYRDGKPLPTAIFNPALDDEATAYNRHQVVKDGMAANIVAPTGDRTMPLRENLSQAILFAKKEGGDFELPDTESLLQGIMEDGSPAEKKVAKYLEMSGKRSSREITGPPLDRDILHDILFDGMHQTLPSLR